MPVFGLTTEVSYFADFFLYLSIKNYNNMLLSMYCDKPNNNNLTLIRALNSR